MRQNLEPTVHDKPSANPLAPRLADVRNKRVGFVDNSKCNANFFIQRLSKQLSSQFGIVAGPMIRKRAPKDLLSGQDLDDLATCDAVIQCFGDCGTSTSITVADAVNMEARKIPTVTVISTAFADAARKQATGRDMPNLQIVQIQHPMHTAPRDVVDARADGALKALVDRLTQEIDAAPKADVGHLNGGLFGNDDQEMLFASGWTDGLPVVSPTAEKVAAMVAASGRDANEEIGPIPPRWRQASIEKIAINAVMAGCRPEYFPVVLTAIEALLEDDCQLYGMQTATNTTAPLIIINGPIVEELGINARCNVFGEGVRANATIGRAVQLVFRNIGGNIAGETDMATHGQPGKFTACIAEAEADSPWKPFHVDAGFDAADSTVTVIGASAPQNIFTYGYETGKDVLDQFIGSMMGLGHNNIIFPTGPLLVVSPEHAAILARDGIGKEQIKAAIFEQARIPLTKFGKRTVEGLRHRRSRWFAEVGDAAHIGVADRVGDINIVVAGGAGIHSLFVPTAFSYRPVTKRINRKG
jgi:hypothetical protein